MKKLILIIIVLAAITEGCKKYPDGPWISFRSAGKRLYGYYTLTKYTVNGVDSLSLYNDSLSLTFHFFTQHDDYNSYCVVDGERKDGGYSNFVWMWIFIDNNKFIKVHDADGFSIGTGPFGYNILPKFEILRLTNKEFNMKTTYNGKEYYVKLAKL